MIPKRKCVNDKKIAVFDTSWLRSKYNLLDERYPNLEWIRAVSHVTHHELNDTNKEKEIKMRQVIWRKYEQLSLHTLLTPGLIIAAEHNSIEADLSNQFPLVPEHLEKNIIKPMTRGENILDGQKYSDSLKREIYSQTQEENKFWDVIDYHNTSQPYELSLFQVEDFINSLLEKNEQILINVGRQIESVTPLILKLGLNRFDKEYPATSGSIKCDAFLRLLKRPQESINKFSIKCGGEVIKISKSFISDIKVSSTYLHYIDKFISADKAQYFFLKEFFPIYANKIDYVKN